MPQDPGDVKMCPRGWYQDNQINHRNRRLRAVFRLKNHKRRFFIARAILVGYIEAS